MTRQSAIVVGVVAMIALVGGACWLRWREANDSRHVAVAGRPRVPATPKAVAPPASASVPPAASAAEDFEALMAELLTLDQKRNSPEFESLLARLAKLDPLRALGLVDSLNPKLQNHAKDVILGVWMHGAPRVALGWAKTNYPDFFNMPEYTAACVDLRDISLVEDWLLPSPESVGKNFALRRLTQQWAKVDPAFITTWAQNLTSRGVSAVTVDYAVCGALQELARDAPEEALQWIDRTSPADFNSRRRYFQAVAMGVNETSGIEAVEKIFRPQPNNPNYNLAINEIVKGLAVKAPERVDEWLSVLENPESRKAAMVGAMATIAKNQPDLAAQLFVSHYPDLNAERSIANLQTIVTAWAVKDQETVLHFLDSASQLTSANRQQLRNAVLARR